MHRLPRLTANKEIYELEEVLKEGLFQPFEPQSVAIVPNRGIGYVRLDSVDRVERAIAELSG